MSADIPARQQTRLGLTGLGVVLCILILGAVRPLSTASLNYTGILVRLSAALRGQSLPSDLVQDILGFRALVQNQDPYPRIDTAIETLGLEWPAAAHASTHPPTDFLLAAPVAWLPWSWASAVWAWAMIAGLALGFRAYGLPWKAALGMAGISLLWLPAATSLGQMTVLWMLGLALGYRWRNERPAWSGACIALASMTKFTPALMLIYFVHRRQWKALAGFAAAWGLILSILILFWPHSIQRYWEVNQINTPIQIARPDNESLLIVPMRLAGSPGILATFLVLGAMLRVSYRVRRHDFELWLCLSWFSVACLPLLWIYSLLPLLPGLWLGRPRWSGLALLIPTIGIALGPVSVPCVLAALVLYAWALARAVK